MANVPRPRPQPTLVVLNAEEEPELPDYPKEPSFRKHFGPRGVLHCWADGKGGQKIEDTGPLAKKRMETIDEEVTDKALDFIDRVHAAGQPFFLWYNTTAMHFRTHCAKKHESKSGQGFYNNVMVAHDESIGRMLAKLDELGIADDTIVMYSTDNGPHYNSWPDAGITPFRSEKNTNWEGGWRVPAFARWPGKFPAGTVLNGIVSHQDWLPTLLAAVSEPDISAKLLKGPGGGGGAAIRGPDGGGSGEAATQDRSHDAANQITGIGGGITPEYDDAGNLTGGPKPGEAAAPGAKGQNYTYDAWNRLVAVEEWTWTDTNEDDVFQPGEKSNPVAVATYEYDRLGRRTVKIVRQVDGEDVSYQRTDYLYDEQWQVVEERADTFEDLEGEGGALATVAETVNVQWLWDIRYVDAPVLRWRDADLDTETGYLGLEETLYVCDAANMNVTALVSASGTVEERYVYEVYGKPAIYDGDWQPVSWEGSKQNAVLYCGYRWDFETGLYQVRYRYYHPTLGRWTAREPIDMIQQKGLPEPEVVRIARDTAMASSIKRLGPEFAIRNLSLLEYADGAMLYIYGGMNPTSRHDATGLVGWDAVPFIGWAFDPEGANVQDYAHLAVTLDECCRLGDSAANEACPVRISLRAWACTVEVGLIGGAKAGVAAVAGLAAVVTGLTPLGWGLAAGAVLLGADAAVDLYRIGRYGMQRRRPRLSTATARLFAGRPRRRQRRRPRVLIRGAGQQVRLGACHGRAEGWGSLLDGPGPPMLHYDCPGDRHSCGPLLLGRYP